MSALQYMGIEKNHQEEILRGNFYNGNVFGFIGLYYLYY